MIRTPSLHLNSEYSLLESAIKIDDLISFAIDNEMKTLVLTDHNVMFGAFEFVKKCENNNIKPVIGLDLDVRDFRLILLAKNYEGFQELMRLSSKKESGQEISHEEIDMFNLIAIDHPEYGYFIKHKEQLNIKNYYIGTETETFPNAVFARVTKTLYSKDARKLAILKSIGSGEDVDVKENMKGYMEGVDFDNILVQQASSILEGCDLTLPENVNPFPKFKIPNDVDKNTFFKTVIEESSKELLSNVDDKKAYIDRIKSETKTIIDLGFVDYFLLIWDMVKWAKSKNIIIGPGRGSAAGSLIIYILGITEVDPLKFDLLFERFLNKERISLPDVDIDIQDDRRSEVVDYLFEKYGDKNVAQISTFARIGSKTALRDSARINKFPIRDINSISKLVPNGSNLSESFSQSARFRAAIERTDEATMVFNDALLIEGFPRQKGTHAAGIVVSDSMVETKVPTTMANDKMQTQYTMDFLETNGLIKLDLLGLRNLSILEMISDEIFAKYSKRVNLNKIPLNDEKTNKLLSSGDTDGIFQFESYGMKKTLNQIGVSSFNDVIAILSLYRPGPMDFIPLYAQLKKGVKKVKFISKEFNAIVDSTYGIIIYQEQIMMIAQDVSGMSFGQADILRRAISKKKISLINSLKDNFISGAINNGYKAETANEIYSMIEKFANYGFNKSHAVAYGMLSYRMAYLKAWFPTEFYTSLIKSSAGSKAQIKKYIDGAKKKGIKIVAPSIETSKSQAYCIGNEIFLPLIIIKGFGDSANTKFLEERSLNGDYSDFFNFISRMSIASLGEAQIATLIESGSLSKFGNVQTLLDSLPSALRYTKMITIKKDGESVLDKTMLPKPILVKAQKDSSLEIKNEIKLYGFQLSTFETESYELDKKLIDIPYNYAIELIVLFDSKKVFKDSADNDMARITLVDSTRRIEAVIFSSAYRFIENDKEKSIVKVKIKRTEFNGKESFTIISPWKVVKNG